MAQHPGAQGTLCILDGFPRVVHLLRHLGYDAFTACAPGLAPPSFDIRLCRRLDADVLGRESPPSTVQSQCCSLRVIQRARQRVDFGFERLTRHRRRALPFPIDALEAFENPDELCMPELERGSREKQHTIEFV